MRKISRLVYIIVLFLLCLSGVTSIVCADDASMMTDMAGRKVKINVPVKSIVTTFKPATLCVASLGIIDKLVGVDTSATRDRLLQSIYPGIKQVTAVGKKSTGVNFETLVSLKPDLVILYSQKDGMALADRLEKINIPAIIIVPETFDTIKSAMKLIARTAGVSDRMVKIEDRMDNMLELLKTRLSGLPEEKRKKVYFASSRGLFSTTTGNMLQHEIITRAGTRNVSGGLNGYFQNISPEQLIQWNPDIMILSQHIPKGEIHRLAAPVISPVTAVRSKKVWRFPSTLAPWDFPSPLSVLGSLWLAEKAYPEFFNDLDIQKEADDFHQVLFGLTMTDMNGAINDQIVD